MKRIGVDCAKACVKTAEPCKASTATAPTTASHRRQRDLMVSPPIADEHMGGRMATIVCQEPAGCPATFSRPDVLGSPPADCQLLIPLTPHRNGALFMLPATAACTQRKAWPAARLEGRRINDRSVEWAWASAHAGIRFQGEARRRGARACRGRDRGTSSASFGAEPAGHGRYQGDEREQCCARCERCRDRR